VTPHELFGPAARQDQFPVYALLRGNGPVRVGPTRWALLDHKDVRAALADPIAFSSDLRSRDNPVFASSPLIFDDPPKHTRIRKLVGQAFTVRQVALVSPWLSTLAAGLFDGMGSEPVDVIDVYCDPFPTLAIARLLGVPSEAHGLLKQWSLDRTFVAYHGDRDARRTPALEAAERGCAEFATFLLDLVAERRARPQEDLLSALAAAEVDGAILADEEIADLGGVLLSAGNVTTTRLLGNLFHLLASSRDLLHRLRDDRAMIAPVVEEMLRLESPVQFPARITTRDVELSGTTIPAGHFVMVGLGAANRDGVFFPDPDCLRPGERPPHLAFGYGIHFCAGAALARQEAAITLHAVLDRYDRIELATDPLREEGLAHRGYARLVVQLRPRHEPHSSAPVR
jgi:cytochrome P450